jgi:hypothetical protein
MIEEHFVVWEASKFPTGRLGGAAARQYFSEARGERANVRVVDGRTDRV